MLLLRDEVIRAAMDGLPVIDGLEHLLSRPDVDALRMPPRITMEANGSGAFLRLMPVVAGHAGYAGYKMMTFHPKVGVRYLVSLTALGSGELEAVLDADWITAQRTALTAAIAVRHLARDDARTVTVLGSGTQARALLEATAQVLRPSEVLVHSPSPHNRERFAADMAERLGVPVVATAEPRGALRVADVVLSAYRAGPAPGIAAEDLRPGVLVCAISSVRPHHRELDTSVWRNCRVVVDDRVHVAESGDGRAAAELGLITSTVPELWQVLRDPALGRRSESESMVFKSVGTAEQDIALAALVLQRAVQLGVGEQVRGFPSVRAIQAGPPAGSGEIVGP